MLNVLLYNKKKMKRKTDYATLVGLIEQYRNGNGKFLTALDYYIDFCDNRKIYEFTDDFTRVVINGTDEELEKRMQTNVENAISYYD